ncbi:hypothetical protein VTO42DRAFT_4843 [Malbranchea cinnamomea]
MAVGDFVHGKGSQQNIPQRNDKPPVRASRLRAAELARVEVPRRNQDGFANTTSNTNGSIGPAGSLQRMNGDYGYEQHGQERVRDMFDTDLEGIDDSTTVTSLTFERNETVQSSPRPRERVSAFTHIIRPQNQPQNVRIDSQGASSTYRTVAERMRELDSDMDDYYHENGVMHAQANHPGAEQYEMQRETDFETAQINAWDGTQRVDEEPMTWQKIEQVLHDNRNTRLIAPEAPSFAGMDYQIQNSQEMRQESSGTGEEDDIGYRSMPQTPRALPKTPAKAPISVRSRFMTPNFQDDRRTTAFGSAAVTSRSFIPRPSSAPGVPLSPESNRRRTVIKRTTTGAATHIPPHHLSRSNHLDQQYPQGGGIFDNTDLSALDSSDSTDLQDTFSPTLSTLSPVSSKRPLSATTTIPTPFVSDYPPNILRGKSFADLEGESFDYNPAPPKPIFPPQEPAPPLAERLTRLKSLTDDQRRAFFSSLTMAEWEESGDWLIEQFSIILQKTKEARAERRKVAAVFEAEIKRRYELAENEGRDVRKRLDEMRSGGMGVLRRQNSS